MLERIIQYSIHHKLIVILFSFGIVGFGLYSLYEIPIGAVPDVTNNQVQIITTSRNLATEDVEKFLTYPVELEMANLPDVQEIRSVSKFGLSVVTVVFNDNIGTYLPRQLIAEKIKVAEQKIPRGFGQPFMGPISTGLGEIYQYVTKVDITRGVFLNPSQIAVTIVDTEHLHLELTIFEKDLPKIDVGQTIQFRIQEDKGNTYMAEVLLVNKTVDPKSRTIGVHGHLSDQKITSKFSPGMYVEADIYSTSINKVSLPEDALVEIDGQSFALVLESASNSGYTLVKKEIIVGETNNGFIEILNQTDFNDSTQFLIKGAFNLITE